MENQWLTSWSSPLFSQPRPRLCNIHLTSLSLSHRDEPFSNLVRKRKKSIKLNRKVVEERDREMEREIERWVEREREREGPIRYLLSAGVRLPPMLQSRKDIFKLLNSNKDFSLYLLFIYLLIYCPLFHPGSGEFPFDFETKAAPAHLVFIIAVIMTIIIINK